MCQAKKDGGRRCATHHPATVALKSVAEATTDLNEGQINYIFRNLRQDEVAVGAPSATEYRAYIAHVIRDVSRRESLNDKTRARLNRSLERALTFDQIPNAAAFQAQARLIRDANALDTAVKNKIALISRSTGKSAKEVTEAFNLAYENTTVGRLTEYKQPGQDSLDPRTDAAFEQVLTESAPKFEKEPRVRLSPHPKNDRVLVGRDPADGRVEFEYEGNKYAFRNVSEEDWEAIQSGSPLASLQHLSSSPENKYDDDSAASTDAYRVWCDNCRRYHLASGHNCDGAERMNLLTRAYEINEAVRSGQAPVRTPAPYLSHHTPTWMGRASLTEASTVTSPGASREGQSTRALRFGPSPEELANEFRANGGRQINFVVGRRIPIRGEDGYHEVTHEYIVRPLRNNVGALVARSSRRLRCTCPEYQANYRCQHSHPTTGDNDRGLRGNVLALRDVNAQIAEIEEALGTSQDLPYYYIADLDEDGHLTDEQLTNIQNLTDRSTVLLRTAEGEEKVYVWRRSDHTFSADDSERRIATVDEQVSNMDFDRDANTQAENLFSAWQMSEGGRASLTERQVSPREPGYRENVDQFLEDYRSARNSAPSPIVLGPVTNGALSTGPGEDSIGYGVELEVNCSGIQAERIAERLYEMELSDTDSVVGYHSGYETWRVEDDCTVGAEIVSPILYDNAEDWDTLNKVVNVIREEGGEVGVNTGGHIHVGRRRGDDDRRVLAASMAHMDVLRRLSAEPARGTHRTSDGANSYAVPFSDEVIGTIYEGDQSRRPRYYRENSVNLTNGSTVEFREPDSSLDAGRIQAQVMMCSAIMDSARNDQWDGLTRDNFVAQMPGTNYNRVARINQIRSNEDPDSDEMVLAREHPLMSSLDTLFRSHDQRRRVLREVARAPWQSAMLRADRWW